MSVCEQVREIFSEKLHVVPPADEEDLIKSGVLDSFKLVELLLHLEQAFGLKFTVESLEIDDFRSIASITSFVDASNDRRSAPAR